MRIEGDMTVYTAAAVTEQVLASLTRRAATEVLDLSKVSELDTAGLQILLVARRHVAALGRELRIVSPSPTVRGVMELLQLTTLIDAPDTAMNSVKE
jgi:anti-sigma B factor antagonist